MQPLLPAQDVTVIPTYLYDTVDVGHESVHAHLHQHDERSTHVLTHIRVFIRRQVKQILQETVNYWLYSILSDY